MSLRKNRPVLYEVIARSRGSREPLWKRRPTADRAASTPPAEPDAVHPPSDTPATTRSREAASTGSAPASAGNQNLNDPATELLEPTTRSALADAPIDSVPALQVDKDGVVLTLSWAGVATLGVTLILALAFAFQAGSLTSGSKSGAGASPDATKPPIAAPQKPAGKSDAAVKPAPKTASPPSAAPAQPPPQQPTAGAEHRPLDSGAGAAKPAPKPEEPRPAPSAQEESGPSASFEFKPGYEYLIVQHFTRSQKDAAEAAEAFLKKGGIDCVLLRGRELTLVCTQPFLLKQKDAAARSAAEKERTQLKQRVRQLGTEFAKTYGFAFDQCYTRVMKQP